jgi:GT2 family glycosyltransferase
MLSIDLFICTRDRQETLLNQIDLLSNSFETNKVRLVVVDNSNLDEIELNQLREKLGKFTSKFRTIELITSEPGLVHARNVSLDNVKSDIIIFIDDDVRLPREFFEKMRETFVLDDEIVGCSPLINGLYSGRSGYLRKFVELIPIVQGKITLTAHTFWVDDRATRNYAVQWLPGCCMAYRSEAIQNKRFSEDLLQGASGGYSLGEDVDFSARVGREGKLICASNIKIFHDLSPINRENEGKMQVAIGEWRRYAAKSLPRSNTFTTFAFELLYLAVSSLRGKRTAKLAVLRWKGFRSNSIGSGSKNPRSEDKNASK